MRGGKRSLTRRTKDLAELLQQQLAPLKFAGRLDPGKEWDKLVATQSSAFYEDAHVPGLYVFGPAVEGLAQCAAVASGTAVMQQKASCLPPLLLATSMSERDEATRGEPQNDQGRKKKQKQKQKNDGDEGGVLHAVDACAAPGNKTSQLAALLGPRCSVLAYERDPQRFRVLCDRTRHLPNIKVCALLPFGIAEAVRAQCVEADFLAVDVSNSPAQLIMVDPSCSGRCVAGWGEAHVFVAQTWRSGIVTRITFEESPDNSATTVGPQRLAALSAFQVCWVFVGAYRDRLHGATGAGRGQGHVVPQGAARGVLHVQRPPRGERGGGASPRGDSGLRAALKRAQVVARVLEACPDWELQSPWDEAVWPSRGQVSSSLSSVLRSASHRHGRARACRPASGPTPSSTAPSASSWRCSRGGDGRHSSGAQRRRGDKFFFGERVSPSCSCLRGRASSSPSSAPRRLAPQ